MKELFERIAKFQDKTFVHIGACRSEQMGDLCDCHKPGAEIKALLYDCQSAITELQLRIGAEVKITNQVIEERDALKTQLEKAEALLRTAQACLESEGYEDTPREIAAYFREKEKP